MQDWGNVYQAASHMAHAPPSASRGSLKHLPSAPSAHSSTLSTAARGASETTEPNYIHPLLKTFQWLPLSSREKAKVLNGLWLPTDLLPS